MKRLFCTSLRLVYEDRARRGKRKFAWWPTAPSFGGIRSASPTSRCCGIVRSSWAKTFFNEIIRHPVPLDMNTLKALKRSSLGLDLYLWTGLPHLRVEALRCGSPGGSCTASSEWTRPRPATASQSDNFRTKGSAGVEEDQAGLAGVELHDGQRGADPLAFETSRPSDAAASARGIAGKARLFRPLGARISPGGRLSVPWSLLRGCLSTGFW